MYTSVYPVSKFNKKISEILVIKYAVNIVFKTGIQSMVNLICQWGLFGVFY